MILADYASSLVTKTLKDRKKGWWCADEVETSLVIEFRLMKVIGDNFTVIAIVA